MSAMSNRVMTERLWAGFWYLILSGVTVALALPLVWLVSTSLKTGGQTFLMPPKWIPDPFVWSNYPDAFKAVAFHEYFWNTARIVFFATVGTLFTGSLAAYAFARLRFPLREPLFLLVLSTIMLPSIVTLIPTFIVHAALDRYVSATDRAVMVWRRGLQHLSVSAVLYDDPSGVG